MVGSYGILGSTASYIEEELKPISEGWLVFLFPFWGFLAAFKVQDIYSSYFILIMGPEREERDEMNGYGIIQCRIIEREGCTHGTAA
ncbi:hypothetical protein [Paenibacillus turpanensis]|uniref:hypothetical protein n=1 Tax=Paenibacillus turpanensis TaxID=2689078 RepID=UPI00140973D7|nr:hypothetical protein [Paenibacillus turpanensis]